MVCVHVLLFSVLLSPPLAGKLLWELIEPVELRTAALLDFLREIDATLHYDVVPIYNPYGPTIEDSRLQCLYVSEETMRGGKRVNEEREKRVSLGFKLGGTWLSGTVQDAPKGDALKMYVLLIRESDIGNCFCAFHFVLLF